MLIVKIKKKFALKNRKRGCKLIKASKKTKQFDYATDVIYLDENNQMGIEFDFFNRIRIDGVVATDEDSFNKMMSALVYFAIKYALLNIVYADSLSVDMLNYFLRYGFVETEAGWDRYNHYLTLNIMGEAA